LEGEPNEAPEEWLISIVAEEFHITPRQARRELDEDDGLILDILDLRSFARAHADVKAATSAGKTIDNPRRAQRQVLLLQHELRQQHQKEREQA